MSSRFIDKFLKQVPKKWDADTGSIMKTARVLASAKNELPRPMYKDLVAKLGFTSRLGQRIKKLGTDQRLYDPVVLTGLPDSWGTIEQIHLLDDKKFEELVSSGRLKPTITRQEVLNFKNGRKAAEKKSWAGSEKLVTIRVRGVQDPIEAQELLDEFLTASEALNKQYECTVVEVEDHQLPSKVEKRQFEKLQRDFDRAYKNGLKVGRQICRYVTRQMKKQSPDWLKQQVKRGQKNTTWSMEENHSPQCYEGLEAAFGELNIDLDVEELQRDPEVGQRYFDKLKESNP